MSRYIYLVYTDTTKMVSLTDFHAKVGMGSNNRLESYITPYGNRYLCAYVLVDNPAEKERELIQYCIDKNYIQGNTERLSIPIYPFDMILDCVLRYDAIINDVIRRMSDIGTVLYYRNKRAYNNTIITFYKNVQYSKTPTTSSNIKGIVKSIQSTPKDTDNDKPRFNDQFILSDVYDLIDIVHTLDDEDVNTLRHRNGWNRYWELKCLFDIGGIDIHNLSSTSHNVLLFPRYMHDDNTFIQQLDRLTLAWHLPYKIYCRYKWNRIMMFLRDIGFKDVSMKYIGGDRNVHITFNTYIQ